MSIVDRLYRLTDRDFGQPQVRTFHLEISATGGAVAIGAVISWPNDRILAISSISVECQAGAGQVSSGFAVTAQNPTAAGFMIASRLFSMTPDAAIANGALFRGACHPNELLVPPSWRLVAQGDFTFVAAVNTVRFSVAGVLLPQGSVLF